MNALRSRILFQMMVLGLGPLTAFALVLRFLPGGLLPWFWYGALAMLTVVMALALSGRVARPLKQGIAAFRGLVQPEKGDLLRKWVPAEYWEVREDLKKLLKDIRTRNAELESNCARHHAQAQSAEKAALRSLEVLHGLVDSIPEGVAFMHGDGHLALMNQRCMELFQLSETNSRPGADAMSWLKEAAGKFTGAAALATEWSAWQSGPPAPMEGEWVMAGASPRAITVRTFGVRGDHGENLGRVWLFRDVTDERQVHQRLQDSQKMESMGQLAGGIAHDFNNLLTAIRGSLALAMLEDVDARHRHEYLENAAKASARAADLVGQILGYSRGRTAASSTDVKVLLSDLKSLLRASLDPRITLECDDKEETWKADLPHVQLEQVLLNLCLNARDALTDKGGTIRISSSHHLRSEAAASTADPKAPAAGEYVVLHVKDDGMGIPEEVKQHLFEPFFTTKEPGKGTGLGLATSDAIVTEAGGWIELESEVGKGTEFRVYLPRASNKRLHSKPLPEKEIKSSGSTEAAAETAPAPRPGSAEGVVLVVDDEDAVRSIAVTMLKYLGYKVVEARDGEAALEILEKLDQPLDAILLDVHMPKLSGRDTYKRIRAMGIDTPVIVCSGFIVEPEELRQSTGDRTGAILVIQKPYSMDTLARTVSEAVSRSHHALPA
jgi:two-component system, cell cycle sensor histidine kinase and response regulator CckA